MDLTIRGNIGQFDEDVLKSSTRCDHRRRIITSRNPFANEKDRSNYHYKPKRTKSFSQCEPSKRDALAELKQAMRSDASQRPESKGQNPDNEPILRLPAPHDDITLRPVRRRDVLQFQKLFTSKLAYHFNPVFVKMPGEFNSCIQHIEDIIDENWMTIRKPSIAGSAELKSKRNIPPFDSDAESEDEDEADSESTYEVPQTFAIAQNDVLIGMISLDIMQPYNLFHLSELCYWIGEPFWGRGIATAVVKVFLKFCWENFWWLTRIDAFVYSTWNPVSRKILGRVGMTLEGTQRRAVWQGSEKGYSDIEVWSMLREEWEEKQKEEILSNEKST